MVKILQHLKVLKIRYLSHAEHHEKNRTSLSGLDQETLFFYLPLIMLVKAHPKTFVDEFFLSGASRCRPRPQNC